MKLFLSLKQGRVIRTGLRILVIAAALSCAVLAKAQTYQVMHRFQGGEGAGPGAGLTIDAVGCLYGTTGGGGAHNFGTVFKLARAGSGWTLNTLYSFKGGSDGVSPAARVVFGPDGALYGTTYQGGGNGCGADGCGTIFKLKPRPAPATPLSARGTKPFSTPLT